MASFKPDASAASPSSLREILGEDAGDTDLTHLLGDLPLAFRFGVTFFMLGGPPNPLDVRFQKVSGLSATIETSPLREGGQNLYTQKLPSSVAYENLVLERGLVVGSPLNVEINAALSLFRFATSNVLVTLFNEAYAPMCAWFFFKAFPVKWSTSDLDANGKSIVVDRIELAYARMQIVRV